MVWCGRRGGVSGVVWEERGREWCGVGGGCVVWEERGP